MAAFVEFLCRAPKGKGGAHAIVEVGAICGVITPAADLDLIASDEAPLHIILRGGETIEIVAISARDALKRVAASAMVAKANKYPFYILGLEDGYGAVSP